MSPAQIMKDLGPKRITVIATGITAVLTAIITTMHFGKIAEPYWVVMRYELRTELDRASEKISSQFEKLTVQQIETQIAQARNERARILDRIGDRELLLQSNPTLPEAARAAINEQIRNWRDDIRDLDFTLDQLQRSKSGRRP